MSLHIVLLIAIFIFAYYFFRLVFTNQNSDQTRRKRSGNNVNKQNKNPEIHKEIKSSDYDRFILVRRTTMHHLNEQIKEFSSIFHNEEPIQHDFLIAEYANWKIVKVGAEMSFYEYHNLTCWFHGYDDNPENPEMSFSYAKSNIDPLESYLCHLDVNNKFGDTMIGAFAGGDSFYIYIPDAYDETGNLTISNKYHLSYAKTVDYIKLKGLDISAIDTCNFVHFKI